MGTLYSYATSHSHHAQIIRRASAASSASTPTAKTSRLPAGTSTHSSVSTRARRVSNVQYHCYATDHLLLHLVDYKKGFGGQYGVQSDRKDKSAAGWDEHEPVKPHESQTG